MGIENALAPTALCLQPGNQMESKVVPTGDAAYEPRAGCNECSERNEQDAIEKESPSEEGCGDELELANRAHYGTSCSV